MHLQVDILLLCDWLSEQPLDYRGFPMSEGSRATNTTTRMIKDANANPTNSVKLGTADTFYSAMRHCWNFTCRCMEFNHFICTRRNAEGQGGGGGSAINF